MWKFWKKERRKGKGASSSTSRVLLSLSRKKEEVARSEHLQFYSRAVPGAASGKGEGGREEKGKRGEAARIGSSFERITGFEAGLQQREEGK